MAELLRPTRKDIAGIYEGEFLQMAQVEVSLDELLIAREELIAGINQSLTDDQRQFPLCFKSRKPDWNLLGIEGADKLPAVRWKMRNLEHMPDDKHRAALASLERVLEGQRGSAEAG